MKRNREEGLNNGPKKFHAARRRPGSEKKNEGERGLGSEEGPGYEGSLGR